MRDLAARLNIKAASLYAHIRSKDELLEWICFSIAGRFFEGLNEVKNAKLPAKERLNLFIENIFPLSLKIRMLPTFILTSGSIWKRGFLSL